MSREKNAFKSCVCLILAIITSIAMTMNYSIITSEELTKLSGFEGKLAHAALTFQTLIPPASIMNLFIAALAFLLYRGVFWNKKHRFSGPIFFLSILLALFLLIGISYSRMDSWDMVFYAPVALTVLLGYAPPFMLQSILSSRFPNGLIANLSLNSGFIMVLSDFFFISIRLLLPSFSSVCAGFHG